MTVPQAYQAASATAILALNFINAQFCELDLPAVAYRPDFAEIGGGTDEGIFLSQLEYWTNKLRAQRGPSWDGWLYNTVEEWQKQTGLTRRQQDTVKRNLFARGLIEYRRAGRSGVLHYRLNVGALLCLLAQIGVSVPENAQKRQTDKPKTPKTNPKNAKPLTEDTPEIPLREQQPVPVVEKDKSFVPPTSPESQIPNESQEVIADLVSVGFSDKEARALVRDEGTGECTHQLGRLAKDTRVRKPVAWLRTAIRGKHRDEEKKAPPVAPPKPSASPAQIAEQRMKELALQRQGEEAARRVLARLIPSEQAYIMKSVSYGDTLEKALRRKYDAEFMRELREDRAQ